VVALVLGIVGIIVFPPVAPFAWWQGIVGKRKVDRGETLQNRGLALTGQVLGIIGSALLVLYIVFFVIVIIIGIASST